MYICTNYVETKTIKLIIMKQTFLVSLALVLALALSSCKSKESNFRKAYDLAKANEMADATEDNSSVTVTPVIVNEGNVNTDNVAVRTERLDVMNGGSLKAFNVVCGSFSSQDNANNLRNTLVNAGYSAQVAQNPETKMFRVIAATFDDKAAAVASRDKLRATYPDAWLLYRTY